MDLLEAVEKLRETGFVVGFDRRFPFGQEGVGDELVVAGGGCG